MIKLSDPRAALADKAPASKDFVPTEVASLAATGLPLSTVESLVLKQLLVGNVLSGRQIAETLRLPLPILIDLLRRLKTEQIVVYKSSSGMNDYEYELTPAGFDRAAALSALQLPRARTGAACRLCRQRRGPIPVERSSQGSRLVVRFGRPVDRSTAFRTDWRGDFLCRGHFPLRGAGNGKTSIAERLTSAFSATIWIPRVIDVDGEIIQMFDPMVHNEVPPESSAQSPRADQRWIHIRRPTIVAGGELTLENLDFGRRVRRDCRGTAAPEE